MADTIKIEILEDGTIKIATDAVSMPNHANAGGLLRELITAAGGRVDQKRTAVGHVHNGHYHEH